MGGSQSRQAGTGGFQGGFQSPSDLAHYARSEAHANSHSAGGNSDRSARNYNAHRVQNDGAQSAEAESAKLTTLGATAQKAANVNAITNANNTEVSTPSSMLLKGGSQTQEAGTGVSDKICTNENQRLHSPSASSIPSQPSLRNLGTQNEGGATTSLQNVSAMGTLGSQQVVKSEAPPPQSSSKGWSNGWGLFGGGGGGSADNDMSSTASPTASAKSPQEDQNVLNGAESNSSSSQSLEKEPKEEKNSPTTSASSTADDTRRETTSNYVPYVPGTGVAPYEIAPEDINQMSNTPKDICSAQWLLLMTTAAYAPENPEGDDLEALDTFYREFQDQCLDRSYERALKNMGHPKTDSRRNLMRWLCMAQNMHRKGFKMRCDYNALMDRWRYPDGYM